MNKILLYVAGGCACLGIGAYFYSVLPAAKTVVILDNKQNDVNQSVVKKEEAQLPKEEPIISIIFGGDIMLGRSVAAQIKTNGTDYPFAKINNTIAAADFAIANLEGPITKINNEPANRMRFHFDPSLAQELAMVGFDAFSLANNHGLDQGSKGLTDDKKNLEAVGLKYFGDPSATNGSVYEFTAAGKKIAVIGFQMVYGKLDPNGYAKAIADAKKNADIVIVMPHWGIEYEHTATKSQKDLARQFIDAGADIIVGSHPHVLEGIEIYKDKPIFYSLGNLVFDQYFSEETQEGMMLRLNLSASKQTIELLPYKIPQSQPVLAEGEVKAKMLNDIASWSAAELKEQIIAGSIAVIPSL